MIIDTHTHTYFESLLPQEDELIARMAEAWVESAFQIAVDIATSRTVIAMARRRPKVFYPVIGIHPNDGQSLEDIEGTMDELKKLLDQNRDIVIAIGETGLDRHYPETGERELATQREFFRRHAILANEYDLPLVIHTRDAWEETIACLAEFRPERVVMHCYLGDLAIAQRLIEVVPSVRFAFGGATTYRRNDSVRDAAARLPLDRILVETDAPFLSPEPLRGKVNEPSHIRHTLEAIKKLRSEPEQVVEETIYQNTRLYFCMV